MLAAFQLPGGTMTHTLLMLAALAALNWALILGAALLRSPPWRKAGLKASMGNRDQPPDASPLAARTDRAAKNMLENMVLFTALVVAASAGGVTSPLVEQGAGVFFWARLVYIPIYMLGIPYVRTVVWAVSIGGLGMMLTAVVRALSA